MLATKNYYTHLVQFCTVDINALHYQFVQSNVQYNFSLNVVAVTGHHILNHILSI